MLKLDMHQVYLLYLSISIISEVIAHEHTKIIGLTCKGGLDVVNDTLGDAGDV